MIDLDASSSIDTLAIDNLNKIKWINIIELDLVDDKEPLDRE